MRSVEEHTAFGRLTEKQRSGIELHRPSRIRRHVRGTPDLSKLSGEGLYPKTFFSRGNRPEGKTFNPRVVNSEPQPHRPRKTLPNWNRARTQTTPDAPRRFL